MIRKCKKWPTRTWHSSTLLIRVTVRKHTDHIHVIKHVTLHSATHVHFFQALTLIALNFDTHKHHLNKQATIQYASPIYVEVPQLTGSLNTCIINTYYVAQCWEQVPQNSNYVMQTRNGGNFRPSHVAPRCIHRANDTTEPQKHL